MTDLHAKFHTLYDTLNNRYAERDTEIYLGLVALLTSEHFLTIGMPGTAKSMLANDLAHAFGVPYMRKLLGKTTPPEELFGPYDIAAMKNGQFRRVSTERTAQRAVIQFWDEIFKSSSAIRNNLLTIMNERYYDHGDEFYTVPLITVFAASNELPEDSEESSAFFDRFLLRRFVTYIKDPSQFVRMLRSGNVVQDTVMSETELRSAQELVQEVRVPQSIEEAYLDLRATLDIEGIQVSDRRWKQSLKAVKASAWLDGRDVADDTDLSVLQHILWDDPQNIKTVMRAILSHANPIEQAVVDIMDQLEQIEGSLREEVRKTQAAGTQQARQELREQGIEWFTKTEGLGRQLKDLESQAVRDGRNTRTITDAMNRLEAVGVLIGSDAMNIQQFSRVKDQMKQRIFGD